MRRAHCVVKMAIEIDLPDEMSDDLGEIAEYVEAGCDRFTVCGIEDVEVRKVTDAVLD